MVERAKIETIEINMVIHSVNLTVSEAMEIQVIQRRKRTKAETKFKPINEFTQ